MPIVDLQQQYRENGRIRLGKKHEKGYPTKLETFRFTSPMRSKIEEVARLYGGEVQPWQSPRGQEFEVVTKISELSVVVPQQDLANSQWWEEWGVPEGERGVRLIRRESTEFEGAKPTTHLLVKVPDLVDPLGVWRITTRGINAAKELPATIHTLTTLMAYNVTVDATLVTAERSSIGPDGEKRRFRVIEIHIPYTANQLMEALPEQSRPSFVAALTAGPSAAPPPVRPELPPTPDIAALPETVEPVSTPELAEDVVETVAEVVESWPTDPDEEPDSGETVGTTREMAELELASLKTESAQMDALHNLLDNMPAESDTKPVWERWVRMVFGLMAKLKYWGPGAMHAVLARKPYETEHLTSLNKGPLVKLGTELRAQAKATIDA